MIADTWQLEPDALYLHTGNVPEHRPWFQGDVFNNVPFPALPTDPGPGRTEIEFPHQTVILVPHPCGCYHGDALRPRLTVCPIEPVPAGLNRLDYQGNWSYFPLPGLVGSDHRADLGCMQWLPTKWLQTGSRIASLSLEGVALLNKRLLMHLSRVPWTLANLTAHLHGEWADAQVWTAFHERYGQFEGYEEWKSTPQDVHGLGEVVPRTVIPGRVDHLISYLSGNTNLE